MMTFRNLAAKPVIDLTSYWWVLLVTGCFWLLVALAVLQFSLVSVWSIALLTGAVLCLAALTELFMAAIVPSWKWAHALLSVLFLAGGILAFAWPGSTFLVLSRLIAWYLLFYGTFEVVEALSLRRTDIWWLRLIGGAVTIGIAFWAVGSLSRSAAILVLWVGIGALFRGLNQIFLAFEFRSAHEEAKRLDLRSEASVRPEGASIGDPLVR